jgi:hypothetical protein
MRQRRPLHVNKSGIVTHVTGTCKPMIFGALLTTAKLRKQPRCPITDGLRKCGTYTQWNFIQPEAMKFCHSQVNEWNWRV